MNYPQNPQGHYLLNIDQLTGILNFHLRKKTRLGWIRLIYGLLLVVITYFLFVQSISNGILAVVFGIALFLWVVSIDEKNNREISRLQNLLFINTEEVSMLAFSFHHRENGLEFLPHDHPYVHDIDLLGKASIYQYINRCTSQQGKHAMAQALLEPATKQDILSRQETIKKLSAAYQWQQDYIATGVENPVSFATENKIQKWLHEPMPLQQNGWKVFVSLYSAITLLVVFLFLLGLIPVPVLAILIFLFFIFSIQISKNIQPVWQSLSGIVDEIETIQKKILLIEKVPVATERIGLLQAKFGKETKGSVAILHLQKILNRFDYRLNILVFFGLNTFLLWDLRQLINLQGWKKKHESEVPHWFEGMAEMEVLNSLSILHFNHPEWVFPKIVDEHFSLSVENVGHPLLKTEQRINNDFAMSGIGKVSVITGSNMAGKSTFLRSLGVNLVLAQAGSVVCASSFVFSPVRLYSSMRIADNLAENTSTFYAELKKLKTIIDEVNKGARIFILLDEILRGTNSLDRHTGSEALIKQLIKHNAVAVIATHDVELGALSTSFPTAIANCHFDVQVAGEELYFDYKLKAGICQSMNASLLMKKIGIELGN